MLYGIPSPTTPPDFSIDKFKLYIPKLKWYVEDSHNIGLYNLAVGKMKEKLNYSILLEEWEEAMSLAIAHFILITDPRFAQSTDGDATAGGVMRSRTVAGVSYEYDIEYYLEKNQAHSYWNVTGYGRRLVALVNSRGWIGVVTSD